MNTLPIPHLRIARPVMDPSRSAEMYCRGLGFEVLGQFKDHEGFDGVMVGHPSAHYHLEFVHAAEHNVQPAPTVEDLLVFYIPDAGEWWRRRNELEGAGFQAVESFNPYWSVRGRTYADCDNYRTVLECAAWPV
jgi:catechol 2,3-dioxygenase-like lactoylglutathione lyase family enzyme